MGYTLTIGEIKIETETDCELSEYGIGFRAEFEIDKNAPAFGDDLDYKNWRDIDYSVFPEFLKLVGLYDVFYDSQNKFTARDFGVRLITAEMVSRVSAALNELKLKHPDLKPEFNNTDESAALCRLMWFDYWLTWAIGNCKTPVISNQ